MSCAIFIDLLKVHEITNEYIHTYMLMMFIMFLLLLCTEGRAIMTVILMIPRTPSSDVFYSLLFCVTRFICARHLPTNTYIIYILNANGIFIYSRIYTHSTYECVYVYMYELRIHVNSVKICNAHI